MMPILIKVENTGAADIHVYPACFGLPLPIGFVYDPAALALAGTAKIDSIYQISKLNNWHDGSLKWILIECLVSVKAGESRQIELLKCDELGAQYTTESYNADDKIIAASDSEKTLDILQDQQNHQPHGSTRLKAHGIQTTDTSSSLCVNTGKATFTFQRNAPYVFPDAVVNGVNVWAGGEGHTSLIDLQKEEAELQIRGLKVVECSGHHRTTVAVEAQYVFSTTAKCLNARFEFTFFANSALIKLNITLHNPAAACHPGGLWDLGDKGSVLFSEYSIKFRTSNSTRHEFQVVNEGRWESRGDEPVSLFQASSGGDAWDSPVHADASGQVQQLFRGYQLDGLAQHASTGRRSSPAILMSEPGLSWQLKPVQFWQNCPKALEITQELLTVSLFPRQHSAGFELQAGEQKTHSFYFDLDANERSLNWVDSPLRITVPASVYSSAEAFVSMNSGESNSRYDELVALGLSGKSNFFHKREAVDEYGWRHFGDLHADHETWNSGDTGIFVSHYNNQYDPVYGFARQFIHTGNHEWFTLMKDLANHVMDIDVYRTDQDRVEYNGGLFWHTDHYVQAFTSTHRTFSKFQAEVVGAGNSGGPGGEHCYTTGLAYYYLMTGERNSKCTVLSLCEWISRFYEGSGTLLETLQNMLKREVPSLIAVLRGEFRFRYKFPLDRGVGNYIVSLLDCLELTGDRDYLVRAEEVIRNTIGPNDELAKRDLGNIEATWFYTIFLQCLIRYLDIKRQREEFDEEFYHGRETLLHYSTWMAFNEKPYLKHPENLEFPNRTWSAQDVRKAAVLCAAHYYRKDDNVDFLRTARGILNESLTALEDSPERHFTRILAILMQNHGCVTAIDTIGVQQFPTVTPHSPSSAVPVENSHWTAISLARHMVVSLAASVRRLSPTREWRWLRSRLAR